MNWNLSDHKMLDNVVKLEDQCSAVATDHGSCNYRILESALWYLDAVKEAMFHENVQKLWYERFGMGTTLYIIVACQLR